MMKLKIAALTDVGILRDHNEDNFIINPDLSKTDWFFNPEVDYTVSKEGSLLIVADGMGGTNAGEVASKLAVDTAKHYFHSLRGITEENVREVMVRVFPLINESITNHSQKHPETEGMGTTMTIAWLRDDAVHVAWIGDSRAYLLRPGNPIQQISKDHSLVQEWIDQGKMNDEQAFYHPQNNIVTKSLGAQEVTPEADYTRYPIQSNDRILVCSDGLNGMLLDPQIEAILNQSDPKDIIKASNKLVKAALEAGGKDNITLVLAYVLEASGIASPITREVTPQINQTLIGQVARSKVVTRWKTSFFVLLGLVLLTALGFWGYAFFNTNNVLNKQDEISINEDTIKVEAIDTSLKLKEKEHISKDTNQKNEIKSKDNKPNKEKTSSVNNSKVKTPTTSIDATTESKPNPKTTSGSWRDQLSDRPSSLESAIEKNERIRNDSLNLLKSTSDNPLKPPLGSKPINDDIRDDDVMEPEAPEITNPTTYEGKLVRYKKNGKYGYRYKDEKGKWVIVIDAKYKDGAREVPEKRNKIRVKMKKEEKWEWTYIDREENEIQ